MKNIIKALGLAVLIIMLLINTFMINKLTEQNSRIEANIIGIQSDINNKLNNMNSIQNNLNQKPKQKDIMTPLDLAEYLGIDMDKVYSMAENKDTKIPYINIDGEYRFNRAAIDEWMKTSKEIVTGE